MTFLRSLGTACAIALMLLSAQAFAAGPPTPSPVTTVCQNSGVLAVTAASARVVLPCSTTNFPAALIINDGATELFFSYGSSSVVAVATNIPLPAGASMTIWVGSGTNIAAITSSGTTTLRIVQANGSL